MIAVTIKRENNLIDEKVVIQVTGVTDAILNIEADVTDEMGQKWSMKAEKTVSQGCATIDLEDLVGEMRFKKISFKNPFRAIFSMMFRGMFKKQTGSTLDRKFLQFSNRPVKIDVKLGSPKSGVIKKTIDLVFHTSNNTPVIIKEPFFGKFFPSRKKGKKPAILVLGGSAGGFQWSEQAAAILSERGFNALAVSYFDYKNNKKLPNELRDIPLEYFNSAVQWLKKREEVDTENIGILGLSKGSEAALLYNSFFQKEVKAVAAYVPTAYSFEGVYVGKQKNCASWTYRDEKIPFLSYPSDSVFSPLLPDGYIRSVHDRALSQSKDGSLEKAFIDVSKTQADILLISGGLDGTWPSSMMSERLAACNGEKIKHIDYKKAGHVFVFPNMPPFIDNEVIREEDSLSANRDAWEQVKSFFTRGLCS